MLFADAAGGWATWEVVSLVSVPLLVALNGYFVAAEFALVAIRRTRVEEMVQQGAKGAKAVESAVVNLDRSVAASQLGITVASLLLGWVGEDALAHLFDPLFASLPGGWSAVAAHSAAVVVALTLITFMHVVFGEQMPKLVALQTPERVCLWVAAPLNTFARVSQPLIWFMNGTSNVLLRWCGYKPGGSEAHVHSVEELSLLIEDAEEAGNLEPDQAELVQNIFELSDKTVRDCMVPREKMASLERSTPPEKVLEAARTGAHTRMPVYEGEPDNVVGIVNTKDLFYLFSLSGLVVLDDALYPATFLDPDESIANALRLFRKSRRPMALVRDEAGKIHGLITLEDVLEEIVGEIEDEHDRPVPRLRPRRKGGALMVRRPGR